MTTFDSLDLIDPLLRAVAHQGYDAPTPIQVKSIPLLLQGRDVLGCAQTGTGKTAAFALPMLQHLVKNPPRRGKRPIRALVLSPTRELAAQIDASFGDYGRYVDVRHTVIFGGVSQTAQVRILRRGLDVLVATPGRLLDLASQAIVDLGQVELFVLDEADRMLDMGFIHDIRRVLKLLPPRRQNLLFSATMPKSIADLGASFLKSPAWVEVTPQVKTVEQITQRVLFVSRPDKRRLLVDLLRSPDVERVLIFTRTKHGANRLVKQLDRSGIRAAAIHGNKSQNARRAALEGFRKGTNPVLVATDLAARGIDVEGISHVFNFDLPNEPETYVHRIGRTGRAGASGVAISFCDDTEGEYLREIEKLTGQPISVERGHAYECPRAEPPPLPATRDLTGGRSPRGRNAGPRRPPGGDRRPSRRRRRRPNRRPGQATAAPSPKR